MKILYAAPLSDGSSARYRLWALERLGHTVVALDTDEYEAPHRLVRSAEHRLAFGPGVARLNRDVLRQAEASRPDVFWADKLLQLQPSTLQTLRRRKIFSVSYMIDNAFGPRRDPGWRLYMKDVPLFDLHVTQRDVSVEDYRERGARDVIKIQTAFEETMHFPPPEGWSDRDRDREVSFVGTPYDDRARILAELGRTGVPVSVSGRETAWAKALQPEDYARVMYGGLLYEARYREAIWKSKINLSFLTRANLDEYTHKSFEIAGCAGFLLAERCPGHLARFVEGDEAVFFDGIDELKLQIARYLPDEAARARIAAAGRRRAIEDGYGNDRQVGLIVKRIEQTLAPPPGTAA